MTVSSLLKRTALAAFGVAIIASPAAAGKFEKGKRNIKPLFEDGTYAEFRGIYVMPSADATGPFGGNQDDFYEDRFLWGVAVKADITSNISAAIIVDQPFSVDLNYNGSFVPPAGLPPTGNLYGGTEATLNVTSITALLQYNFENGFSVFGGPRVQIADAEAEIPFIVGTSLETSTSKEFGYTLGAAFEIPQFKIRASIAYHSEITHEWDMTERNLVTMGLPVTNSNELRLPQGVDFEFQFPVSQSTLIFGNVHWADWSGVTLTTPLTEPLVGPLREYFNDVWSFGIGIAQRFTPNLALALDFEYEPSTGENTTTFDGRDGFWRVGAAAIVDIGQMKLTAGVSYFDFNEGNETILATIGQPAYQSLDDQSAWVVGVKLGFNLSEPTPAVQPLK